MRARSVFVALLVLSACTPGSVGDPCIPDEEQHATFGGFAIKETSVESRSLQCASRLCLVHHFQGRVSCPYGQDDLSAPATDPARCRLPGTTDAVTVRVESWDTDRAAPESVYCSCRCAGPDPDARYCECPSGFSCVDLLPHIGLANEQLEGSYCVKQGTEFSPEQVGGATCETDPEQCPGQPFVNP